MVLANNSFQIIVMFVCQTYHNHEAYTNQVILNKIIRNSIKHKEETILEAKFTPNIWDNAQNNDLKTTDVIETFSQAQ